MKTTVYRLLSGFAISTVLLVAKPSALAQDGVSKTSISIGQSTALTGPQSPLALPYAQGAKLVFDRINAAGGINGRSLNLTSLDDAADPATSKTHTQKMAKDGALVLFGYYGSLQTIAAHDAVKGTDLLLFAPMSAADELRGSLYPNLYLLRPGYSEEAAAITRHAETLGMRKLAILHGQDADSLGAAEAAERTMTSLGANLVAKAVLASTDKALAAKPESLLIISDFVGAAAAVKDARAKGYRGPIYGFSNTGESLLADQLGKAGAGVVLARVTPKSDNAKSALVREMTADALAAKLGKPNVYMMEGYIAARTLAEAIRKAGKDITRAKLKKAIDSMTELDLGGFRVHFNGDRVGSKLVELSLIDSQGKVRE